MFFKCACRLTLFDNSTWIAAILKLVPHSLSFAHATAVSPASHKSWQFGFYNHRVEPIRTEPSEDDIWEEDWFVAEACSLNFKHSKRNSMWLSLPTCSKQKKAVLHFPLLSRQFTQWLIKRKTSSIFRTLSWRRRIWNKKITHVVQHKHLMLFSSAIVCTSHHLPI